MAISLPSGYGPLSEAPFTKCEAAVGIGLGRPGSAFPGSGIAVLLLRRVPWRFLLSSNCRPVERRLVLHYLGIRQRERNRLTRSTSSELDLARRQNARPVIAGHLRGLAPIGSRTGSLPHGHLPHRPPVPRCAREDRDGGYPRVQRSPAAPHRHGPAPRQPGCQMFHPGTSCVRQVLQQSYIGKVRKTAGGSPGASRSKTDFAKASRPGPPPEQTGWRA